MRKFLFENRFNRFDILCILCIVAIVNSDLSLWYLLPLVPAAVISYLESEKGRGK